MAVELLADRFLREAHGWIDLATGDVVHVAVTPWTDEPIAQSDPAPNEMPPGLIDNGRVGTNLWFEARALGDDIAEPGAPIAEAIQARARHVSALAEVTPRGIQLVRAPAPVAGVERALGRQIAARLRRLGIVAVRADLPLSPESIAALSRRHVAVLCYDERGEASTADWVRRLSLQTLRGHLVVDVRSPGSRTRHLADAVRATEARERAPHFAAGCPGEVRLGEVSQVRLARAMSCVKRGRHAAGERWLRAAVESGRRRGDEESQARAGRELIERGIARNDWPMASRVALDLLKRLKSWHARAGVGDVAGRVLIATGDLRRADGLLAALSAEAVVLGQSLPAVLRLRLAQVRFWRGRFEEAQAALGDSDPSQPEDAPWPMLCAWASGDRETATLEDPRAGAVAPGVVSESFARACTAEALIAGGRAGEAWALLGPSQDQSPAAPLDIALIDWLRSRCAPEAAARAAAATAAEQFIQRTGAHGITRWGLGRTGMHLLHAIPALLQIVHDADDDIAMLARGTDWIRSHAGAEAAAVLTHDGGRVVAGAGFGASDARSEIVREVVRAERPRAVAQGPDVVVASPVVLGGVTIGVVVARGRAPSAGTLAEAAAAVASLCAPSLRARLDALAQAAVGRSLVPEILGRSPAVQALCEGIVRAAGTTFPVLIEGESGTGKELVARAVHRLSARRDRRFCAINCAALTDELVEAELFGHTRGAFTGATGPRAGLFEEAHMGTLFLDEIGELSARAQAKLLRVLQEREIRRVGENLSRPVDVRVVAATNRRLSDASGDGLFRDDLRFRLAVVRFRVPPLRERLEDVPLLAQAFWRQATAEVNKRVALGPDAIVSLCKHAWPGNVRELQNAIAALAVIAPSRGRVNARHVTQVLAGEATSVETSGVPLEIARRSLERRMVSAALVRHAGSRVEAARELGLSRQGLTKAIKRLGVDPGPDAEGVA